MGSQCSNAKTVPTLADNVMNHDRVKYIISPHISQSLYTVGKGVLYTLGETNSISVGGSIPPVSFELTSVVVPGKRRNQQRIRRRIVDH